MMPREHLVGTIIKFKSDEGGEEEFVLIEFAGEGADKVVFATAHVKDLSPTGHVIRIWKPSPFLEMDTLHYSLRIHEAYPNHPLRMSPEERMRRLTSEMIRRIQTEHLIFRVDAYRDILDSTLIVIARECNQRFSTGALTDNFLDESPAIKEVVDECFLHHVSELLESDQIAEEYRELFEFVAARTRPTIERWKATLDYHPFSENPLFNLLGLFLEDFINEGELFAIVNSDVFTGMVKSADLKGLFELIATLHFCTASKFNGERRTEESKQKARAGLQATLAACNLLEYCANRPDWRDRHLLGLAKLWKARTCYLSGETSEKTQGFLEAALQDLTEPRSLPDRHDALIELLNFRSALTDDRISQVVREIGAIRQTLGAPDSVPG
jgi:hypothetical protein